MKFGVFNLFKKKKRSTTSHDALMAAFNYRYANFKEILESNSELLKIIADIEHKMHGGQVGFGAPYLDSQTLRIAFHAGRMIRSFENLSGRPYPALNTALESILRALQEGKDVVPVDPVSDFTLTYSAITRDRLAAVGGKNAALGEIMNRVGLPVPMGFAITTAAYDRFLRANQLDNTIQQLKRSVDIVETQTVLQASEEIQARVMAAEVPEDLAQAILEAYDAMASDGLAGRRPLLAVRSSAIMEDGWLSFAGQYLTVLNVPREGLLEAYKRVLASLFAPRAIAYRMHMGIPFTQAAMGVACLEMVASKASGVMYTRNPLDPSESRVIINAVWGLGAYAVDGVVPSDTYLVSKETPPAILERTISRKPVRLVPKAGGDVVEETVAGDLVQEACLTDDQILRLAECGLQLEAYFQGPQDVEWALDANGRLVILQARALRLEPAAAGASPPAPAPPVPGYPVLLEGGDVACPGAVCGPAVRVRSEQDLAAFPDGGILVSRQASAEFVMVMGKAQAIVAESGSITGHLAALVKEYMVPTLLNVGNATGAIPPGAEITVDAYHARIYLGRVPELLEAEPARRPILSEEDLSLRRKTDLIIPLNLFNPRSPQFAPQYCRTIHDIMRYVHEKSYGEIFKLGDMVTDHERLSVRLKAPLPLDLYLIDLGGGLGVSPETTAVVKPDQITSAPFKALLHGLLNEGLRTLEPRPVNLGGFFTVMARQVASPQTMYAERFGDKSFGIISKSYLNFSSRVGYHYSILDAFCGDTANKNYINFEFKGGAADDERRNRRARMIQKILNALGFQVRIVEDRVTARFAKRPRGETEDRLDQLGRLLIFTRQMDMLMSKEDLVAKMAACFLEGNYHLCRTALEA